MTVAPKRIQMRRTKGWRKPDGAVYVGRPTRWGNPVLFSDVAGQYPSLDERQLATMVMRTFAPLARRGELSFPNWRHANGQRGSVNWTYPSTDTIREELAGKDLACWCPLDQPCHADVLLELANAGDENQDDELEECTGCGHRAPADDLAECVNHIPMHGRGPFHCHDCVNSGCCGACQDQAAREWQAEHGGGPR